VRAFHRLSTALRWAPREALAAAVSLGTSAFGDARLPPQTRWAKLPDLVRQGGDLLPSYQLAYALFLPRFQRELVGPDVAGLLVNGLPREMHDHVALEMRDRSPLAALSVLEQRLPDAARYLPLGRKALLRQVGLRGLDPALFERPKSGFVLPFDRWIRRGLRAAMDRTLRDPEAVRQAGLAPGAVTNLWRAFLDDAPGLYWSRVWALYVLVRWCAHNGVRA